MLFYYADKTIHTLPQIFLKDNKLKVEHNLQSNCYMVMIFSYQKVKIDTKTVTAENHPFERFCFLKLSEIKQWKSFVKIRRNYGIKRIKMACVKTYIDRSAMKISFILSQHSFPFLSIQKLCTKNLNLTISDTIYDSRNGFLTLH